MVKGRKGEATDDHRPTCSINAVEPEPSVCDVLAQNKSQDAPSPCRICGEAIHVGELGECSVRTDGGWCGGYLCPQLNRWASMIPEMTERAGDGRSGRHKRDADVAPCGHSHEWSAQRFRILQRATSSPAATCVNDGTKEPATRVRATPGSQPDSSNPSLGGTPLQLGGDRMSSIGSASVQDPSDFTGLEHLVHVRWLRTRWTARRVSNAIWPTPLLERLLRELTCTESTVEANGPDPGNCEV
jgi:hypothetical protein